jgi:hypothetical protein
VRSIAEPRRSFVSVHGCRPAHAGHARGARACRREQGPRGPGTGRAPERYSCRKGCAASATVAMSAAAACTRAPGDPPGRSALLRAAAAGDAGPPGPPGAPGAPAAGAASSAQGLGGQATAPSMSASSAENTEPCAASGVRFTTAQSQRAGLASPCALGQERCYVAGAGLQSGLYSRCRPWACGGAPGGRGRHRALSEPSETADAPVSDAAESSGPADGCRSASSRPRCAVAATSGRAPAPPPHSPGRGRAVRLSSGLGLG